MVAELIRPSLLEFVKKGMPGLDSKGFICFDDLGEFRKDYVKEVLQDEIGERITSGVVDSLRSVSFNGVNGICGGDSQTILYSTDSGAS